MFTWAVANWKLAVILAVVAALGFFQVRVDRAQKQTADAHAEFADYRAAQAEAGRLAERSRRETEQRWVGMVEGVANDGQEKINLARGDAERAGAAEQRMQQRVNDFLAAIRGAAKTAGIATAGASTADPVDLLADLFGRARERARLLAAFADDANARGKNCERYADGLQPAQGQAAP